MYSVCCGPGTLEMNRLHNFEANRPPATKRATPARVAAGIDPDHVERATSTMALKKLATPPDVAAQVLMAFRQMAVDEDRQTGGLALRSRCRALGDRRSARSAGRFRLG